MRDHRAKSPVKTKYCSTLEGEASTTLALEGHGGGELARFVLFRTGALSLGREEPEAHRLIVYRVTDRSLSVGVSSTPRVPRVDARADGSAELRVEDAERAGTAQHLVRVSPRGPGDDPR